MFRSTTGSVPNRPNRPLVVRCSYDGSIRKVNFPSAATCRLESVKSRVEECFSLSATPFSLSYTDDDGEEFTIISEIDLTEAISYFISGDEDPAGSIRSGLSGAGSRIASAFSNQKVVLRLDVVVEYDGPSLSDTSSISGFSTSTGEGALDDGQSVWSSAYTHSVASQQPSLIGPEGSESGLRDGAPVNGMRDLRLDQQQRRAGSFDDRTISGGRQIPSRQSSRSSTSRSSLTSRGRRSRDSTRPIVQPPPLTGPDSAPAPDLLTHSELGHRWLREQNNLVTSRRLGGPSINGSGAARGDLDDDSDEGDEDGVGDIELIRDSRGKFYYSYGSDTASINSVDAQVDDHPISGPGPSTISQARLSRLDDASPFAGPSSHTLGPTPPVSSNCSACGIPLDYLRYICRICGEHHPQPGHRPTSTTARRLSSGNWSDGSGETALAGNTGIAGGRVSHVSGDSPPEGDELDAMRGQDGYELCAGCIESHGIGHAKEMEDQARLGLRRGDELRHMFLEKMWTDAGWADIEYDGHHQCTICDTPLVTEGFKCVSCAKFDLCRGCYRKVAEIHPAHPFLSLPEKPESAMASSTRGLLPEPPPADSTPTPVRHPGAFCHNCLQDIVGPRFHCAVCPSWDLCIQCEAIAAPSDGSGHTSDHIMMKIPLPLGNQEVEAVSRRARDRWFQQDSSAVAAAADPTHARSTRTPSVRPSSPSNETVYAGEHQDSTAVNGSAAATMAENVRRDNRALDHGMKCSHCNAWIMGKRYQCANCPSLPTPYSLCSVCETRSYRVHDPRHAFFKFDRPVQIPLQSSQPLLPLLYKGKVGEVPNNAEVDPRDPKAYLKYVMHRETLCDIHSDQIRGIWLRCAHCAAGFDICQDAEEVAHHDPTHVFLVLKARVNMAVFRDVAHLEDAHSEPLLRNQVYLH